MLVWGVDAVWKRRVKQVAKCSKLQRIQGEARCGGALTEFNGPPFHPRCLIQSYEYKEEEPEMRQGMHQDAYSLRYNNGTA